MFYINYGYGYEKTKVYKTLKGAKIAAKRWARKCKSSAVIGQLLNGKIEAVYRVWGHHGEVI